MLIIAHRGNENGRNSLRENSSTSLGRCLARGWAVETDIRRSLQGKFYLSHDPALATEGNAIDVFFAMVRACPMNISVALNIKELGYERDLVDLLVAERVIDRLFVFDMELLEQTPGCSIRLFREIHRTIAIGARVSDRGESIERALSFSEARVIWLDEFDAGWVTEQTIRSLKDAGRTVFAVSPELHAALSLTSVREHWGRLKQWGVDGICTDYPEILQRFLTKTANED